MIKLTFSKGDMLQKMDRKYIYVHACNSKGVWGRGIALQFKKKFPVAYLKYRDFCLNKNTKVGDSVIVEENGFKIGCLLTSVGYGEYTSSPKEIIVNTYYSIIDLIDQIEEDSIYIQSNVFNSGLFNVPWKHTQKVIEKIGLKTNKEIYWNVWDL
jgi:ADP-ribose 1''-phosphate phosphatase